MDDSAEKATVEIETLLRNETNRPRILRPIIDHIPTREPEPILPPTPEHVAPPTKVDHTLLPIDALEEVSRALMVGKNRFGAWNWALHPLTYTEYLAKAQRHILAFQQGEDIDPGTGRTHIACAICDLMFLQSHMIKGRSTDDRFKS